MRVRPLLSVFCIATLAALSGCDSADSADPTSDKGAEEGELGDYEAAAKADSWRAPTEHGTLKAELASNAEFTADSLFHAWTFDLSDKAEVTLKTSGGQNLDTVMYLYRRDAGADRWGRYIAKNDDHGDSVHSQISEGLEAGEYRVMVKAYKNKLRGAFSLRMTCAGAGCTASEDPPLDFPSSTPYTKGCAEKLHGALTSPMVSTDAYAIEISEIGNLTGVERFAVESYKLDSSEWLDASDLEEWGLEVEVQRMEDGAVVNVTEGSDYSMDYVFDGASNLIMTYFNDQSPWPTWYCGVEGGENLDAEEPDEWCAGRIVHHLPHDQDGQREIGGKAGDEATAQANFGATVYRQRAGLADDVEVSYEGYDWEADNWGAGAEITFSAEGADSATYVVVGEDRWDLSVLFEFTAERMVTVCARADD